MTKVLKYVSIGVAILLSSFLLLPLVFTAWGSLMDIQGVMSVPPKFRAHYTLDNYKIVLSNINFRWPINTLILTVIAVGGSVLVSSMTGYSLIKKNIRLLIIVAVVIPRYALIIPQALIMRYLGLVNTLVACALPILVTPMHILLAETYFRSFPTALMDAGKMDGLSNAGVLFRVILPNSKSLLVCLSLLKCVEVWNDYLWQYLMISEVNRMPMLIGLIRWASQRGVGVVQQVNPVGINLAVSIVLMIPFLILFSVGSKYFIYELKGVE